MIGVIADDLTGAAEIAGIGLRHGLSAEVVWEGPLENKVDLICFDTDSRSLPAEEAGAKASAAAALLAEAGAQWIYKKVDSVLRGPVRAELEAVQAQLGLASTLLVPANPSRNRVIVGGNYFINGRPIQETEFARDPEYPRTNPSLLAMLGDSGSRQAHVCPVGSSPELSGILVGEAATSADLAHWADSRRNSLLAAGGGEFFAAILANEGHRQKDLAGGQSPVLEGPELFVCGSLSESCRQFVLSAIVDGTPVFSLPKRLLADPCLTPALATQLSREILAACASHRRVVLEIGMPVVQDRFLGRKLTLCLAELAATVLRGGSVRHVLAEGGATAVELARQMGWKNLLVVSELAPGVVMSVVGREKIQFTVKPGSYLWPASVQKP